VEIVDARGRLLRRLPIDTGGEVVWDGRDERGRSVGAGVCFVRAVSPGGPSGPGERLVIVR